MKKAFLIIFVILVILGLVGGFFAGFTTQAPSVVSAPIPDASQVPSMSVTSTSSGVK